MLTLTTSGVWHVREHVQPGHSSTSANAPAAPRFTPLWLKARRGALVACMTPSVLQLGQQPMSVLSVCAWHNIAATWLCPHGSCKVAECLCALSQVVAAQTHIESGLEARANEVLEDLGPQRLLVKAVTKRRKVKL